MFALEKNAKEPRFDGRTVTKQIKHRFYVLMGLHKKLRYLYIFCISLLFVFILFFKLFASSAVTNDALRLNKMNPEKK